MPLLMTGAWAPSIAQRLAALPHPGRTALSLVAVTLLGLVLRLWDLGAASLWFDELVSVTIASLPFPALLRALSVELNMALYYLTLYVWQQLVGIAATEWVVRLPSALVGAASVPLIYLVGRRLHSAGAGLAAAALLAVNPYHILLSQDARAYAAFGTCAVLSYLLLLRALETRETRDWLLHGLVTGAMFYLHFYAGFVVLAQGLYLLTRRPSPALREMAASAGVIAALLLPLLPQLGAQSGRGSWIPATGVEELGRLLTGFGGGRWAAPFLYGLAALGIVTRGDRDRPAGPRNRLLLAWFLVPLVLVLILSFAIRPLLVARYLFPMLPALSLLAGIGLARLRPGLAVAGWLVVAAVSIPTLQGGFAVRPQEQWREAVSYAVARARPGDGWVFVSTWGQTAFDYYAGWHWGRNPAAPYADVLQPTGWQEELALIPAAADRNARLPAELERFAPSHPRVWLVLSHQETNAPDVAVWLGARGYSLQKEESFEGIRISLFARSQPAPEL